MKNRRTKRFIDSSVQGALVRRIVLHWLIFLALAFLTLSLWQIISTGDIFRPFSVLILEGWTATAPVLVVLVAMLPIFVWDTLTLSHRFAGPMLRFQSTIKSLNAGESIRPVKLRKGDFWTEFADDLNVLIERLESEEQSDTPEPTEEAVACGSR